MIFTLTRIELLKIFRKWRTYIGFIAIGILVPLLHLAMYLEGQNSIDFVTRGLRDSFILVGNLLNGYWISYIILNALTIHIPFLITLVAGDLLAGEATAGTYRILLTRPISRMQIVTSKFLSGLIYTSSLILFLAFMSLAVGLIIFGSGELIVSGDQSIIIFEKSDILWRFFLAYGFAILSMTVVCSLAMFFSSLVENAIGPIVATMAVIIIFIILSAFDVEILRDIRPYLFTTYILDWREFFDDPLDLAEITKSVLVLGGHIIIFFTATSFIFNKKDILS
ncbi:MAG: ABC transporter permease [Ignavibacteriaceae bacterium]|jgi:ABC-2 type transport system permease protein|nr:ABC transporter permease [Ignavibacteriaceae bacterium]MCU0365131.1 ABC transporter permease [Ignavibacteriaceae bacterium]MCU0407148.1 ABC transporter permease [Ignavibacteriaceae bacterium]MCU0413144.1 ABC transporter permease [Ignavibacteriaceae bacterium]